MVLQSQSEKIYDDIRVLLHDYVVEKILPEVTLSLDSFNDNEFEQTILTAFDCFEQVIQSIYENIIFVIVKITTTIIIIMIMIITRITTTTIIMMIIIIT